MPTVSQSDDPTNSASSSIIEMDEFLPIVKFKNPSSYPEEYGTLIQSDEQVELSEYLDDDKRSYNILSLTTDMKELRLTFTIAQGGSASEDDDGFLEVSLSPEDQSVKLVSAAQMEVKYGDGINVDLEWDGNANKEFYIDFYASDDEDDFNVGEYENVHCGRFKIIKLEIDPRTFSQEEFSRYIAYIGLNAGLSGEYGYGPTDRHDCVTAINRSVRALYDDTGISAKPQMDEQLVVLKGMGRGIKNEAIPFKDEDDKPTNGNTDPRDFLNKKMSEYLIENIAPNKGFYFYGMSIMDGYHSVMVVAKKSSSNNVGFNIFDQHGSVLGGLNQWFTAIEIDQWVLQYVYFGSTTTSGEKGRVTTRLMQLKHREDESK